MNPVLRFAPEQASILAPEVDSLYLFLVAVTLFFTGLISLLILFFAVKYRRRSEKEIPKPIHGNIPLEVTWAVIPFFISMVMFGWGAYLFFHQMRPPQNAQEIFVVGKQWMWKIQHPEGRREINELHVPVGRPVRLKMTSEDVIHSFFIPAFRTKMDVLPGRYTTQWFHPTKEGRYHLFCAEYCGTEHSKMIGSVIVMREQEYDRWLASGEPGTLPVEVSGEQLFRQLRCDTCHQPAATALGPPLSYGTPVKLADGRTVIADDNYLRESILRPNAKIVAGYSAIMPSYEGQVTEEQIMQIIAYIKSLSDDGEEVAGTPVPAKIILEEEKAAT